MFVYDEVEFVMFGKVGRCGSGRQVSRIGSGRILDLLFPILAGVIAHLDSPKIAGKAALLTFPNRNGFSSC